MKKKHWILLGSVLASVIILVVVIVAVVSKFEDNMSSLLTVEIEEINLSAVEDGIFEGSYKALPIDVTVKVLVVDHAITDIEILKHFNGQGEAAEIITESVITAQSLSVDAISGATYSSKVILKAIENALQK